MDLQLKGLSAVVTGGSAGIGAAVVRLLAAEGCHVAFCARREAGVQAMVASAAGLPGRVAGTALDVNDRAAVAAWIGGLGGFDILVANVSALSPDWAPAIATDIEASVHLIDCALPGLQQSAHAAITYVSSKAASIAVPRAVGYGAAKAAMAHYMKSLSLRLLPQVRVNVVSPGDTFIEGGYWDKVRTEDPASFARILAGNPMGRYATADEVARVVAFVSSPAASFVAGANWHVDGGSTQQVQL